MRLIQYKTGSGERRVGLVDATTGSVECLEGWCQFMIWRRKPLQSGKP